MGYVYISKIYFDFIKRIIPHTPSVFSKSPLATKLVCAHIEIALAATAAVSKNLFMIKKEFVIMVSYFCPAARRCAAGICLLLCGSAVHDFPIGILIDG